MDCPYPQYLDINGDGRCISATCPSRDDCAGELPDSVIEQATQPNPDQMAMIDELEHRVNAVERSLGELKRSVALWVESMEGADRGAD